MAIISNEIKLKWIFIFIVRCKLISTESALATTIHINLKLISESTKNDFEKIADNSLTILGIAWVPTEIETKQNQLS